MAKVYGDTLKDALSSARELFEDQIETPRQYIESLYYTQFFKVALEVLYLILVDKVKRNLISVGLNYEPEKRDKWTIDKYLRRLKTFFPLSKYESSYKILEQARDKRNDFIHNCFKVKDGLMIEHEQEKLHLDKNALMKIKEWKKAYNAAFVSILQLIDELNTSVK